MNHCAIIFATICSSYIFANADTHVPVQANSSLVVCEGGVAELVCPKGTVILIVIANYGRYAARVCTDNEDLEDGIPTAQCHNPKTIPILRDKCDGYRECRFAVDNSFFIADPCPTTKKYLEVTYQCVFKLTTTTTTTTSSTATTTTVFSTTNNDDLRKDLDSLSGNVHLSCPSTFQRGIGWSATFAGNIVQTPCPEGSRGMAIWECLENGSWNNEGPNTTKCESDWTVHRQDALNEAIREQDANGIPELLRSITSDTRRPMVAGDLPKVILILEETFEYVIKEPWTKNIQKLANQLLVNVANNLLRSRDIWQFWPASARRFYASRLITSIERALSASSISIHSSENYVHPLVTVEISGSLKTSSQASEYFIFPSMALWAGESQIDSVDVPKEALERVGLDVAHVYYALFDHAGIEMEPTMEKIVSSEGSSHNGERRRIVVSRIVAASVIVNGKPEKIHLLTKPIVITFHHNPEVVRRFSSPECSWWNPNSLKWSSAGCSLRLHNLTHTICACNHMTHFAVLMDITGHDLLAFDDQLLTFITYGSCILSIICLVITFFCFILFGRGGGDRVFIHINVCVSLGLAELVFLLGIWRTDDQLECRFVAGCLLYLFLAALSWMFLEGYQLYRMLVEVFPSVSRKYWFFVTGYGIPGLITAAAAYYDPTGFGTLDHCWLRTDNLFILFFVIPAAVIMIMNSIILITTMCIVCKHSNGGYLPCRHESYTGRNIRSWVKGALALASLLGITWTLGLLWIDDGRSVMMAYAFAVANSLQGLFIFLFHVVFSDKMRMDMRNWCLRRGWSCILEPRDDSSRKTNRPRLTLSPSDGSGSGSEFLYPTSEKLHYSPRGINSSQLTYGPHSFIQRYHQQIAHNGTYDYATITYGEMVPGQIYRAPPVYRMDGTTSATLNQSPEYLYDGSIYQESAYGGVPTHHRPPPEFSPPPPPAGISRALVYTSRRPPSSKMSDDSAYSDGSSMLTTEVTPSGATVLRIDLSKNPPIYCQDL